jgi:hypothetical protein
MNERNERMAAMLATDVPARDLAFEIAVLARIERRRFRGEIARNLMAAAVAAVLLALVIPVLWPLLQAGLAPLRLLWPQGPFTNMALGAALMAASLAGNKVRFPLSRD